jgi:quercetin dioxygenase-like cupin family protein
MSTPSTEPAVTSPQTASIAPIALGPGEGEALWFLGSLATVKAGKETTAGRVAVIEEDGPRGSGSPLHVHHNEDEWFYVIDGELTFWVGGQVITAPAGSFVYGPRDIPHTFTVSSERARFLLVTEPAGFETFMRALSEPAARLEIPPPSSEAPDMAPMVALAAEHGIEILGPPGIPA